MKLIKNEKKDSRPINLVLLAISFIIFGALGIVFVTQMELHPGWAWEDIRDLYPIRIYSFGTEDINKNGYNDTINFADIRSVDEPERYTTNQYGGVYCLDGLNGAPLWIREFNGPVKKVFPIMDVNGDGVKDYFVSRAPISPNWSCYEGYCNPSIPLNMRTNQIISGVDGTNIPILTGDGISFTNHYIHDLISFNDISDSQENLLVLECEEYEITDGERTWTQYNATITTYFINGTIKNTINNTYKGDIRSEHNVPAFELFQYMDQSNLLFFSENNMFLYNLSSENFLEQIYNNTFTRWIEEYEIIEDLDDDGYSEILVGDWDGNITLISGFNGTIIRTFSIPPQANNLELREIHNPGGDGITYFLLEVRYWYSEENEEKIWRIYTIDSTSEEVIWELTKQGSRIEESVSVLDEDLDGDSIAEIIHYKEFKPIISMNQVRRYTISSFISGKVFAILNTDFSYDEIITIDDFDGDGKNDFIISGDDRVVALSTRKPWGLWLSPVFPMGLPLFSILVALLVSGIILIILRGKRLNYRRQSIKEHKLTVAVNILAIALMTLTFLLFLVMMNIFNNTLISGSNNTDIIIAFLTVTIIWYGTLPLTAALYNRFAPRFAYLFIKLRALFFKISKGYKNEIIVLDMGDRKDIGLIIQLKRLVLPLLLSISVGFYAYEWLTSLLGYPREFDFVGSTEFFGFMMGYMLCCVLPMILSFVIFAFFISGNYLLDDAGVVYYRENTKYRQPGDIEPISIWAQSIVKGIAGLSALLTFTTFLGGIDFSGFFGEGDLFAIIFGLLITIVMFGGIPFLTAFSYILTAGEVMELCAEENIQKLYNIMESKGYDISPREITNIYPSGYKSSKMETPNDTDNTENN